MNYELTQEFFFESAHTLDRDVEKVPSRRVHGHTYHAEVTVTGNLDPSSGMLIDLGHLRGAIAKVRDELDHRYLNEVEGLAAPTIENLCRYIIVSMRALIPTVSKVSVARRASGDRCVVTLS